MADKYPPGYGTHWHECWREHHGCCVAMVERLEEELAKCRESQEQARAEAFEEAAQIAEDVGNSTWEWDWKPGDYAQKATGRVIAEKIREAADAF